MSNPENPNDEKYWVKHESKPTTEDNFGYEFWVVMRNGDETPMAYANAKTAKKVCSTLNDSQDDEA